MRKSCYICVCLSDLNEVHAFAVAFAAFNQKARFIVRIVRPRQIDLRRRNGGRRQIRRRVRRGRNGIDRYACVCAYVARVVVGRRDRDIEIAACVVLMIGVESGNSGCQIKRRRRRSIAPIYRYDVRVERSDIVDIAA